MGLDEVKAVLFAFVEDAVVAGLLGLGACAAWLERLAVLSDRDIRGSGSNSRGRDDSGRSHCVWFVFYVRVVADVSLSPGRRMRMGR